MTLRCSNTAENDYSDAWAERGDYWQKKLNPVSKSKARKRRIIHRPLVLSGHGIRLNVDCGTLLIKCGFTHYPQQREEFRFFPRDRQLPSRIVILDGDGSITFDALQWLAASVVKIWNSVTYHYTPRLPAGFFSLFMLRFGQAIG